MAGGHLRPARDLIILKKRREQLINARVFRYALPACKLYATSTLKDEESSKLQETPELQQAVRRFGQKPLEAAQRTRTVKLVAPVCLYRD